MQTCVRNLLRRRTMQDLRVPCAAVAFAV